jgi:hypothetical protein
MYKTRLDGKAFNTFGDKELSTLNWRRGCLLVHHISMILFDLEI